MMKEMHSTPQDDATSDVAAGDGRAQEDAAELDPKALAAIRNLLDTQPPARTEPVAPQRVEKSAQAPRPQQPAEVPFAEPVSAAARPKPQAAKGTAKRRGIFGRMKTSVFGYRPSVKVVIWACFAILVFMRPVLIIGLSLLGLLIMIGVFLVVGYDRFWKGAMGLARWYAARRPDRAAEMHRKLDAFALKWDSVLDHFPEGSVDGLYLPDFGNMANADARHDAALDRRFANLSENEG